MGYRSSVKQLFSCLPWLLFFPVFCVNLFLCNLSACFSYYNSIMNITTSKMVTVFFHYSYISKTRLIIKIQIIEVNKSHRWLNVTFKISCCSNKYETPSHPCIAFVLNTKMRWHHWNIFFLSNAYDMILNHICFCLYKQLVSLFNN